MEKRGPDFYDESGVFDIYTKHRARPDSPNETMEQPVLWDLIGKPKAFDVLDLGCGEASIAKKFRLSDARSYLGVEGSRKMVEKAAANLESGFSTVMHSWLEDYTPEPESFDLVVSSLALHYIQDLKPLLKKVYSCLKPGGRFVFSLEHPVITSSNLALENSAVRQAWIVDNYFNRGPRTIQWMGDTVTIYHRTIEDILQDLSFADLSLKNLRESDPPKEYFEDEELWQRRRRIPLFLFIEAMKSK